MAFNPTLAVSGHPSPLITVNGGTMILLYLQPFPCRPTGSYRSNTTTISTTGYLYLPFLNGGNLDVVVLVSSLLYLGCGYGY
jgi:membrane-associated phospholipid phosphatase